MCDGAPDVTGLHDMDEYIQAQLLLAVRKELKLMIFVICISTINTVVRMELKFIHISAISILLLF